MIQLRQIQLEQIDDFRHIERLVPAVGNATLRVRRSLIERQVAKEIHLGAGSLLA